MVLPEGSEHRRLVIEDIESTLEEKQTQPIIFAGTGLSKRYFNAPSWDELLQEMASQCPAIDKPFEYYRQNHTLQEVGRIFAEKYREWAWDVRTEEFPEKYFDGYPGDIYLKFKISEYLADLTPGSVDDVSRNKDEIELLRQIEPHAIITTNYDTFLETVFPDYQPIIGQEVYGVNYASMGEIFKIHGCVTEPSKIVLTDDDYREFDQQQQYLSAKLLTYFAEHPVMVVGYGFGDENVKKILSDIDRILADDELGLIENIHFINWSPGVSEGNQLYRQKAIQVGDERETRVRAAHAEDYCWVFEAFGNGGNIEGVKIKLS